MEPCSGRQPRCLKNLTKFALAHFAWPFIVGTTMIPQQSITKKHCLGSTRRFHIYRRRLRRVIAAPPNNLQALRGLTQAVEKAVNCVCAPGSVARQDPGANRRRNRYKSFGTSRCGDSFDFLVTKITATFCLRDVCSLIL